MTSDSAQNQKDRSKIDQICEKLEIDKSVVERNFRDGRKFIENNSHKDRIIKIVFLDAQARREFCKEPGP